MPVSTLTWKLAVYDIRAPAFYPMRCALCSVTTRCPVRGSSRQSRVPPRKGTGSSNEVRCCCIDGQAAYPDERPSGPFWTIYFGPASRSTTLSEAVLVRHHYSITTTTVYLQFSVMISVFVCALTLVASYFTGMCGRLKRV